MAAMIKIVAFGETQAQVVMAITQEKIKKIIASFKKTNEQTFWINTDYFSSETINQAR